MADSEQPSVFANETIGQMANSLGVELEPKDFTVIRITFRNVGGSWADLVMGDPDTVDLLAQSVRALVQAKGQAKAKKA